jgi:hypothetical protein
MDGYADRVCQKFVASNDPMEGLKNEDSSGLPPAAPKMLTNLPWVLSGEHCNKLATLNAREAPFTIQRDRRIVLDLGCTY